MKLEKKQLAMIGIGALALLLIYWLFFRKKNPTTESSYNEAVPIFGNDGGYTPTESGYAKGGDDKGKGKPITTTRPSSPEPSSRKVTYTLAKDYAMIPGMSCGCATKKVNGSRVCPKGCDLSFEVE